MAKKGYFFDLDGTLVNTHESNALAYIQAIKEVITMSIFDKNQLYECIKNGKSYREFLPELLTEISDIEVEAISKRKTELYPRFLDRSILNLSLISEIKKLRKEDSTVVALVTTAKRANALSVLKFHGIRSLFDVCIFGDNIDKAKPDPEIYLKALELTGIEPEHSRAFEDSAAGILAAQGAGMAVIQIDW